MRSKQVSAIVYGEPGCGKRTLVSQLASEKNSTLKIEDKSVKATYNLSFAISQAQQLIPDEGTLCLIFVLDITKKDALQRLNQLYIQKIEKSHMPPRNIQVLVATHLDLSNSRKVTTKEMKGFAIEHGMLFQEVSSLEPTVNIDGLILQISNKTRIILKNTKWDNSQEQQQQSTLKSQAATQMSDRIKANQIAVNIATTTAASASNNNNNNQQSNSNRNITSVKYQNSSRYLTGQEEEEEEEEEKYQENKSNRSSNTKHREQQQQSGQLESIEQKISLKIANSQNISQKPAYATIQKRDISTNQTSQQLSQQKRTDSKASAKANEGISSYASSNQNTSNQVEKKETQENLLSSMLRQKMTSSKNQSIKNKDSDNKGNNASSNSNNIANSSGSLIKEGRQSTPLEVLKSMKSICQQKQNPDNDRNNLKTPNDNPPKSKAGTAKKFTSNAQMETEQQKLIKLTSSVKLLESDSLDENENEGRTLPPEPQKGYHQNDNQPTTRSMEEYLATENLILLLQQDHRLDLDTKNQHERSTREISDDHDDKRVYETDKKQEKTPQNQEKNSQTHADKAPPKGNIPKQINYQDILNELQEDQKNRDRSKSPQYQERAEKEQVLVESSCQNEEIKDVQEIVSSEDNNELNSHDGSGEDDNQNKHETSSKHSSNSAIPAISPLIGKPQFSNQEDFLASEYVNGLFGFTPEQQYSEDPAEENTKTDFKLSYNKGNSTGNMKQSGYQEDQEKTGKQIGDITSQSQQQYFLVDSFDIPNPLISSPSLTRTRIQSQLSQQAQLKGNSQNDDEDDENSNRKTKNNASKNNKNIGKQVQNSDEDPASDSEVENSHNDGHDKWENDAAKVNNSKEHYGYNSRLKNNGNNHHLQSTDLKNIENNQFSDDQFNSKQSKKHPSEQEQQQAQAQHHHHAHNSLGGQQSSFYSNKSDSSAHRKNQNSNEQSTPNSSDSPHNLTQLQSNGNNNLLNQHHNNPSACVDSNQYENYSSFNAITNNIPRLINTLSPLNNNNNNHANHLELQHLRSNSEDKQQNLLRFSFSSNQLEDSLETNQPSSTIYHPITQTSRCLSQDPKSMLPTETKYQKIRSHSCINPKPSQNENTFSKNATLKTILNEINAQKQTSSILQGSSSIYSTAWSKSGSNYQKEYDFESEIIETELEFDMNESSAEETTYAHHPNRHISSSNSHRNQPTYQQYFNLNTAFDSNRNQLSRTTFFSKQQKPLLSLAIYLQGNPGVSVDVYSDDNSFCVAERYFAMQSKAASRESIRRLAMIVQQRINEYTAELSGLVDRLEKLKVQSDYQPQLQQHGINNINTTDSVPRLNKGFCVLSPLLSPSEQSQTSSQSQANRFFNTVSKGVDGQQKSYQIQKQQQQQRQPFGMVRCSLNQIDKSTQQRFNLHVNQRQLSILVDSNEDVYEQAFRVIEQYCLPKSCVHSLVSDITGIQEEMQQSIDNNEKKKMQVSSKLRYNNSSSSCRSKNNNATAICNRENIMSFGSNNKNRSDKQPNNAYSTINLVNTNTSKSNNNTSCVIFSPSAKGVHRYIGAMTANAQRNMSHTPPKDQFYQQPPLIQIADLTGNQGNYINNNSNNEKSHSSYMKGSYSLANNSNRSAKQYQSITARLVKQ